MKKLHLFRIACVIMLTLVGTGTSNAASFSDTSTGHANSDAIEYVKTNGIVSGYPDGTYRPDSTINRAEFTKIIVNARYKSDIIDNCIQANINSDWSYTFFPDIAKDAWYAKYICVAKTHNIVQGYPNGFFEPSSYINFAEAAKIIVNTFGYSVAGDEVWYKPFTERLSERNAIPTTITAFNNRITRGEMAEMIYRLKANISDKPSATYNSIQNGHQADEPTVDDIPPTTSEPEPSADVMTNPTCSGVNNSGNDGDYSVCMGNTVTHQLSGVVITPLFISESKVELLIGETNAYTSKVILSKGSTSNMGVTNGSVSIKYNGSHPETGASITVSSSFLSVSSVTDKTYDTPPVIISGVTKKFLTIINIKNDYDYDQNAYYESNKDYSQREHINTLYVQNYNNDNPQKLGLYRFDETFDNSNSKYQTLLLEEYGGNEAREAWVEYRENFEILSMDVPEKSGEAWLEALKTAMKKVVEDYPAEHYGIVFWGHGTRSGQLFNGILNNSESKRLLQYINSIIGKKIDFLDWGTQCNDGDYNVVKTQYNYADYIMASDLSRGFNIYPPDTVISDDPAEREVRFKSSEVYEEYFSPNKTIKQALIDLWNAERTNWEREIIKNSIISNEFKQSVSLYNTSKFENLVNATNLDTSMVYGDVLNYIKEYYPEQEQKFYDFRFHYISTKDFFSWDEDLNGFFKEDHWIWDEHSGCHWAWDVTESQFKKNCNAQ